MWRELAWDSEFFGVPIGSIDPAGADAPGILEAEAEARAAGVCCLYAELDPASVGTIDLLQRLGYRLMEVALDFDYSQNVLVDPPPTTATVRLGTPDDIERLDDQIVAVAPWSRYAVDPRFGLDSAIALCRAWVLRAAQGEGDRSLLLAEDDGSITALATTSSYSVPGKPGVVRPRIDLIATTEPRSGAAQALVSHHLAGNEPGRFFGGPIAARNLASVRFVEQMGYRATRVLYRFHRWLDEDDGPPVG